MSGIDNLLVIGKWSHCPKCAPNSRIPVFSFKDKMYKLDVSMRKKSFIAHCKWLAEKISAFLHLNFKIPQTADPETMRVSS